MSKNETKKIIKGRMNGVFFEYTSWCHRYKSIDSTGKVKYNKIKGFKTEKEAEESFKKYNEEYQNQKKEYDISVSKDLIFKDYLIYWFENIYSERITSNTKLIGSYILYNLIIPNIEYDLKIDLVTSNYLEDIISAAANTTKSGGYTSRTFIIQAMKDAKIGGYITYNPALNLTKYRRNKPNIKILNKEQLKKFLSYAKDSNWYLEILLGLFCGLRKGEILGLKFSDVDLENRVITISHQLIRDGELENKTGKIIKQKLIESSPKTQNSIRRLKVPQLIIDEIIKRKELIQKCKLFYKENYNDYDYISCQKDGKPHCMSALNQCIKKICIKLSYPLITVHSLRHMCATLLLEQGVTLAKIAAFLGHSSVHTTFEYYCEVIEENYKILSFMNEAFSTKGDCDYEN